jgi:2-keto-4-pentenoate hydratase/2-oxohepta-3-ene-1,7-dioic acid hydratase in catechol pathway
MEPLPSQLLTIIEANMTSELRDLQAKLADARQTRNELPLKCWAGVGEIRTLAPIPRPPKIICLGLNYRDHAEEQGAKLPEVPLIFAKPPTAVIGPGQPIVIPKESEKTDYEGELAFVLSRRLKRADAAEAAQGIFGYCCMNDVTEREIQKERVWLRSKGIDTFAPLGPWIVTGDEIADPLNLRITTKLNSRVMQASSTKNLIFTPVDIIVFITKYITLEPGDVISTGTPSGVGVFRKPPVFLKHGDVVEITIDGVGTLSNPVVKEA